MHKRTSHSKLIRLGALTLSILLTTMVLVFLFSPALAFPIPLPVWLSYRDSGDLQEVGSLQEAEDYYKGVAFTLGMPEVPQTLTAWKRRYNFLDVYGIPNTKDVKRAIYYNDVDLGFGRDMNCREIRAGSEPNGPLLYTACYVVNHGFGPGAPGELSANNAISQTNTLATVAMVYKFQRDGPKVERNDLSFYIYGPPPDERLIKSVPLDSQGDIEKFVPHLCLPCHGGTYQAADRRLPAGVENANFLPFDLDGFQFSQDPDYTRREQEQAFRELNRIITRFSLLDSPFDTPILKLIAGWYEDCVYGVYGNEPGCEQNSDFVPESYRGSDPNNPDPNLVNLYLNVVKPYCRTCHIAQSIDLTTPAQLATARDNVFDFPTQTIMPHAEKTFHNFWNSPAPAILANEMDWSWQVDRLDDPDPVATGCQADIPRDCSLRGAILKANESSGSTRAIVTFAVNGTFTLTRTLPSDPTADSIFTGDLDLEQNVIILGNGADRTVIDGGDQDRVFQVHRNANVVLQGITIQGGVGGLQNSGGTLVLNNSVITENSGFSGGGLANGVGSSTEVNNSSIIENRGSFGGGVANAGNMTLNNSTVSGNTADVFGGGLYNGLDPSASLTINHGTITDNNVTFNRGGGIYGAAGSVTLQNSIIAGNTSPSTVEGDCVSLHATFTSQDYNRIGISDVCPLEAKPNDSFGTLANPLDPRLAFLATNGHTTPNHFPLLGSPAIDAIVAQPFPGNPNCVPPAYDQRNIARPLALNDDSLTPACDVGAIELQAFVVTTIADSLDVAPGDGKCADTHGRCSLRAAVQESNARPGHDTILLPPGTYRLTIVGTGENAAASGDLDSTDHLTINGSAAATTIVDGSALSDRVFHIRNRSHLVVYGITIQGGRFTASGGGIANEDSRLTLNESVVRNNYSRFGGGIGTYDSSLTGGMAISEINNSAIIDNEASLGGGISNYNGTFMINNSTVSGNKANSGDAKGGGIDNGVDTTSGRLIIFHSTITGNSAGASGGGISHIEGRVVLQNSIVAGNMAAAHPDCEKVLDEGIYESAGYNLIGIGDGCDIQAQNTDLIGTSVTPLDPRLSPLAEHAGAIPSHLLLPGSPAIDAIPRDPPETRRENRHCFPPSRDQQNVTRPIDFNGDQSNDLRCDIGAVEMQGFTLTPASDAADAQIGDGRCIDTNANCSLRAAIQESNAFGGLALITLSPGTYRLEIAGPDEEAAATGDLDITDHLLIHGSGAAVTIIDAGTLADRVFDIHGATVVIDGVTIQGGTAVGAVGQGDGGGILSREQSMLTLNNSVVRENRAEGRGGGVASQEGATAEINNSTFSQNSADLVRGAGGGLYSAGNLTLLNSTISGNRAASGGGIFDELLAQNQSALIQNSTITLNEAVSDVVGGGGILQFRSTANTFLVHNSIIAGNMALELPNTADCASNLGLDGEFNLVGQNGEFHGCFFSGNGNLLLQGEISTAIVTTLATYGGNLPVHALTANSPAIDSGDPANCSITDQRGFARPADGDLNGTAVCDMGAFELQSLPVTIDVKPNDPDNVIDPSQELVRVVILSSASFAAPQRVNPLSLTFGVTGNENSLILDMGAPRCLTEDPNGDGLLDQLCVFRRAQTGLVCGVSEAILKGRTHDEAVFMGRDVIAVRPCP